MDITIETTTPLPYGLVPSTDYNDNMLNGLIQGWIQYIAGDESLAYKTILCTADPDEVRTVELESHIGSIIRVSFKDTRSVLVHRTAK